ncbi:MAG: putative lipid II flippase FtsW [Kineosporiaceae bacterium]
MSAATPTVPDDAPVAAAARPAVRHGVWGRLDSPLAPYYLVLGATLALTALGLLMVLSSSSIESLRKDHSPYTVFTKQAMFAAVALPLMLLASRIPTRWWTALAWPLLGLSVVGLGLVLTPLGVEVYGNRNWISLGGITLQPSEAAKLALVVWGAAVLARKRLLMHRTVHVLVPVVVPGSAILLGLVLAGHDLGTGLILLALVGSLLWLGGARVRLFAMSALAATVVVWAVLGARQSRLSRINDWLNGCPDPHASVTCWQPMQGKYALASGGWWGVGLGNSREKWSWLPEAHNDFIFAIIGEELGLAGSLLILALFAVLAFGLYRVVVRADDDFVKIATGGVLVWVVGQAVINIAAVLGLLPVVGVPLPLVSSGGSALITTLVALGMVVGFARRDPAAAAALAARTTTARQSLAVVRARRLRGLTRPGSPR